MLLPPIHKILICTCIASTAFAIPTTESHIDQNALLSQDVYDGPRRSSSLLAKIFSGLIERIWPHYKPLSTHKSYVSPCTVSNKRYSRYDNDVVLRFTVRTEEEALAFAEAVDTLYLDVWETSQDWVDVRISKKVLPSFLGLLPSSLQNAYTPVITQLSQTVFESSPVEHGYDYGKHRPGKGQPHDLFFRDYRPLSVIYPWLRQMAYMFPEHTNLFTIGTSYEGRDIPAIRIGMSKEADQKKEPRQTIVITAGSHAREWISISTATFLIRSLIENFDSATSGVVDKLLHHYDIVIIPVMNPDGYEYTWSTDRLWRKNRQGTALPFCSGIEIDRSFPFSWDGDTQQDNPCSESYAGEHPLQAIEAQRLVNWAKNVTESQDRVLAAFVDLHSYSQEILYPYSYSCDKRPSNLEDLEEIAAGLAKAFRLSSGYRYNIDSACEGSVGAKKSSSSKSDLPQSVRTKIEESGGSALDYFYQELGVKYAFQVKLRDTGSYGFLLPRSNIVPTGIEAFNALLGLGKWMLGNRGIEGFSGLSQSEIWGDGDTIDEISGVNEGSDDNDIDEEETWYRRRR